MQGYIFPYISGRSSPNKYINKNFWGGSGQDKSIPKVPGGALNYFSRKITVVPGTEILEFLLVVTCTSILTAAACSRGFWVLQYGYAIVVLLVLGRNYIWFWYQYCTSTVLVLLDPGGPSQFESNYYIFGPSQSKKLVSYNWDPTVVTCSTAVLVPG